MTECNDHAFIDIRSEQTLIFPRNELVDLKSRLTKKDDRVASLDVMLNQVMESHSAEVRAYEDLKDRLEDAIEILRNRVPHDDILDHLRVKDRN